MLRITTTNEANSLTFKLEGRVAGPWVNELSDCWRNRLAGGDVSEIKVDLRGVTFVDAAGKQLLAAMVREGAELIASGCLMKAIVAEIEQDSV